MSRPESEERLDKAQEIASYVEGMKPTAQGETQVCNCYIQHAHL